MANDSLDDMMGWLDDAIGEKDVHHSPTIAVGRGSSTNKQLSYGRSKSCDEIRHKHNLHHREEHDHQDDDGHHHQGYQRASSASAKFIESRDMDDNLFTPNQDGARDIAASASPVETPSIGSHHHHMLPAMSPIVPQKQRPDVGGTMMVDDLVLNSPMGHIDLSTPATATATAGAGAAAAAASAEEEEEEREDSGASFDVPAPTRMLQPRFDMRGALAAAACADQEAEEAEEEAEEEQSCAEDTTVDANDGPLPETEESEEEEEEEMSDEERRRLEEEAQSIELARQLMAEEAMASYHHSAAFLRENADQYSQEDLAALEAAVAEEDPLEDAVEEGEEVEMSYDAMLRLGEQIGDVKQERWAMIAQQHIDKLPTLKFEPSMAEGKETNHTDVRCQVCQCEYEDDEELRRLPCGHCFHTECVDQWLKTHDTCCFCKKSIVTEE